MEHFCLARPCSHLARPCASDAVKKTEETQLSTLARPCHRQHDRAHQLDFQIFCLFVAKSPCSIFICNLISCLGPKLVFPNKYSFMSEAKGSLILLLNFTFPCNFNSSLFFISLFFIFPANLLFQQILFLLSCLFIISNLWVILP